MFNKVNGDQIVGLNHFLYVLIPIGIFLFGHYILHQFEF
jgi:hypothetical protein